MEQAQEERMAALGGRRRFHRLADDAGDRAGEFASWISPPKVGIDNKPGDFEYVKIETRERTGCPLARV
jgi:hypothetical protein